MKAHAIASSKFLALGENVRKLTAKETTATLLAISVSRQAISNFLTKNPHLQIQFFSFVSKYLQAVLGVRPSVDVAYAMVKDIYDLLEMDHPFELFCTRKKYTKFLGVDYVSELTFLAAANSIQPLINTYSNVGNVFDPELAVRQDRLHSYANLLQEKINLLGAEKSNVMTTIDFVVDNLAKESYGEIQAMIEELERQIGLPPLFTSVYMDVTDVESQINGAFQAIIETYGSVL